jgi:hypothetical protein
MKPEGLPVVRIVDPAERFARVRQLMRQWHEAEKAFRRAIESHEVRLTWSQRHRRWYVEPHEGEEVPASYFHQPSRGEAEAAKLEFLAAAETYFMMGRGEK